MAFTRLSGARAPALCCWCSSTPALLARGRVRPGMRSPGSTTNSHRHRAPETRSRPRAISRVAPSSSLGAAASGRRALLAYRGRERSQHVKTFSDRGAKVAEHLARARRGSSRCLAYPRGARTRRRKDHQSVTNRSSRRPRSGSRPATCRHPRASGSPLRGLDNAVLDRMDVLVKGSRSAVTMFAEHRPRDRRLGEKRSCIGGLAGRRVRRLARERASWACSP